MTKKNREKEFENILEENGVFENPQKIKRRVWEFICKRVDELKEKALFGDAKNWEIAEHIVYDMLDEDEDEYAS